MRYWPQKTFTCKLSVNSVIRRPFPGTIAGNFKCVPIFSFGVIIMVRSPKFPKLKLWNWDEIQEKIQLAWAKWGEGKGQVWSWTCVPLQSLRAPRVVWCSWIALFHLFFCKFTTRRIECVFWLILMISEYKHRFSINFNFLGIQTSLKRKNRSNFPHLVRYSDTRCTNPNSSNQERILSCLSTLEVSSSDLA